MPQRRRDRIIFGACFVAFAIIAAIWIISQMATEKEIERWTSDLVRGILD